MADPASSPPAGNAATKGSPRPASGRRSDLMVAALGCALGLTCALFPWYIFFNPEKFGPQMADFAAVPGLGLGSQGLAALPMPGGTADDLAAFAVERLDLFATGTTPEEPDEMPDAPAADEQPYPAPPPPHFRVVFIENGRAMIADDSGLFVVGRGDLLPDNSRVANIGNRDGRPVVVTTEDKVLQVEE